MTFKNVARCSSSVRHCLLHTGTPHSQFQQSQPQQRCYWNHDNNHINATSFRTTKHHSIGSAVSTRGVPFSSMATSIDGSNERENNESMLKWKTGHSSCRNEVTMMRRMPSWYRDEATNNDHRTPRDLIRKRRTTSTPTLITVRRGCHCPI
jgi:hypothetical protein